MICNRVLAMPSADTFTVPPIKEFVERNIKGRNVIVDPFARESKYGTVTNDLNPDCATDYHMDALDFLRLFDDKSVDCVIYDPPYSPRQTWRAKQLDEIKRILKDDGAVLCFGWNSNGVGKKRGFDMREVLIVAHGGSHNDTICTYEVKTS